MRDRVEIAKRLLSSRAVVRELERQGAARSDAHALDVARLQIYRAAAQALAWALDVDLNQTDIPSSLLSVEEQPTTVQLHRLELGEAPQTLVMWLAEIPAHNDALGPDYSTESWSCFLHDEQARGLLAALSAVLPSADSADSAAAERSAAVQPIQPIQLPLLHSAAASATDGRGGRRLAVMTPPRGPDVEGGYADYTGGARMTSSAFDDDDDEGDDEGDDENGGDEPPAASASAGPRRPLGA